jgi:hypothetical protein
MLAKQPSVNQVENMVHPLYSVYDKLLKLIPVFKDIDTEEKAAKMMDDHMGVYSNEYMTKIKGYDKQSPNLMALERVSTYKFKPDHNILEIRRQLAEARLNKEI